MKEECLMVMRTAWQKNSFYKTLERHFWLKSPPDINLLHDGMREHVRVQVHEFPRFPHAALLDSVTSPLLYEKSKQKEHMPKARAPQ